MSFSIRDYKAFYGISFFWKNFQSMRVRSYLRGYFCGIRKLFHEDYMGVERPNHEVLGSIFNNILLFKSLFIYLIHTFMQLIPHLLSIHCSTESRAQKQSKGDYRSCHYSHSHPHFLLLIHIYD